MKTTRSLFRPVVAGLAVLLALFLGPENPAFGQDTKTGTAPSTGQPPSFTVRATTRQVTLQIVARDQKGHAVTGLTAKDFQVSEQVLPKKDQHPQQIAAFQAVTVAAIAAADKGTLQLPANVYSNMVTMQKMPVPPTILVVDGLNTSVAAQMQVHRQMVKMLASIPSDIPVAVFLLDRNLQLLQNFTTDPKLLRAAVQRALSLDSTDLSPTDVREDPNALATLVADMPQPPQPTPGAGAAMAPELQQNRAVNAQVQFLQGFERETFSTQINMRVQITLDAFRAIARHVAGYPGRKNLLWISSSFPLAIFPDSDFKFVGMAEYQDEFAELGKAFSDAKIALYPMDAAGLQAQSFFEASARPTARNAAIGTSTSATVMREESSRSSSQESMVQLADETGGRVCVNNNDLADCVKKAVDDGSSYYELAYYPNAGDWHGEFHRIIVKPALHGVRLSYREGYYARPEGETEEKDAAKQGKTGLQEAACRDLLTSTTILVMAEEIPPSLPGQIKYFLAVDPRFLTFAQAGDNRSLSVIVAACTFDKNGKPLQYLQQPTDMRMTEQQYAAVTAQHAFSRTISFAPSPETARVRLLVRDKASTHMGSVDVPYPTTVVGGPADSPHPSRDSANPAAPK